MTGLFRWIEGRRPHLRFIAKGDMFDWHNNIYQALSLDTYGYNKEFQCVACAFAQRKACKYFACQAEERKDKTDIFFERI